MHGFDSTVSNVPAFLVKLWKLVEDSSTDDLISWSERGNSFIIKDQANFAKELLPQYFKHSNMASFIRQLNMYGFRKLTNFEKGGLKVENHDMEFCNAFFMKDKVMLLDCIKRKISTTKGAAESSSANPKDILTDLTSIREKQESMNTLLVGMKKENELLWRELSTLRKKHKTQEQIIQKVIQFLVSIVQSGKPNIGMKGQIARMLQDSKLTGNKKRNMSQQLDVVRGKKSDFLITVPDKLTSPLGPVIHEVIDHEEPSAGHFSEYEEALRLNTSAEDACSSLSTPESPGPLSLFTPHQARTPVLFSSEEGAEQVLGLPVDFTTNDDDISVPDIASVVSISDNPDDATSEAEDHMDVVLLPDSVHNATSIADNVISIPDFKSDDVSVPDGISNAIDLSYSVSNVISIPEGCNIVPLLESKNSDISLPEEIVTAPALSDSRNNTISIPEVTSPSGTTLNFNSDLIPFSPPFSTLFSPKSTPKEQVSYRNVGLSTLSLDAASSSKGKTLEKARDVKSASGKLCSVKKDPFLSNKPECSSNPENLQIAVSDMLPSDNTITKNAFSNHVLSVEEELNWLQEQLTSGTLNLDSSMLLGLFSTDAGVNNAALASQLTSDSGVLRDADMNIIGNELVQFNPSALDMTFEDGLLDCLEPEVFDVIKSSENGDKSTSSPSYERVLQNIKKEKIDDQCSLVGGDGVMGPTPPKKLKSCRVKAKRKGK